MRLGVLDGTADRVASEDEISDTTGIAIPVLRRYLRTLQAIGLVVELSPGNYTGTPMAELLRSDGGALYGQALMAGTDYYQAWSELDHALITGTSAFARVYGGTLWQHFATQPSSAASFARTMGWNSGRVLQEVLNLYNFPDSGLVLDLGAGDGTLIAGILRVKKHLRGMALEQPPMVPFTRQTIVEQGLSERCEVVAGDLLQPGLPPADIYLLKSVLHNWDDQTALAILRNCRDAMKPNGRLLLVERGMDASDPIGSGLRDLTMLVLFGARDRTVDEHSRLLRDAGFITQTVYLGSSGLFIVEAEAAG
ncbi:MAG: methyltransferase [Vicinamibacterales bacterium]